IFPRDLLKEALDYSNKYDCPVTFSTTDHNSILGTKEICDIINNNPEKYKKINYITGCEFSVSCESLGTYKNYNKETKTIFHSFHLLGYNFDVNDKVINYYSTLKSLSSGDYFSTDNARHSFGSIVLAGKKFLNRKEYDFPLSHFTDFKLIKGLGDSKEAFIENINKFYNFCKDNFSIKESVMNDMFLHLLGLPNDYFSKMKIKKSKHVRINREDVRYCNVIHNCKIDVMEMMSIIENAGGVSVLAHPYLIRLHEAFIRNSKIYAKNKFYKYIPLEITELETMGMNNFISENVRKKSEMVEYVVKSLTDNAIDPITRKKLKGIVGLEILHSANMTKESFDIFTDMVEKYNLYATGGSDKHGDYYKSIFSVGQVMPLSIENKFTKKEIPQAIFSINSCKFVDDLLEKRKLSRRPGNNEIELLIKTPRRVNIFDFETTKKFIKKFSRSEFNYLLKYQNSKEIEQKNSEKQQIY
ncbi:MAG: hypothetical protein PHS54_04055, partial [Clostridia bacterium]|nr:hypothetical protein [Clostridia bacterium]